MEAGAARAFPRCHWSAHPLTLRLRPVEIARFTSMKILLRNTQTGFFYVGPGQWTPNDPEAFNFEQTDLALDAVRDGKLKGVEVLMKFENPSFEIPLTVIGCGG